MLSTSSRRSSWWAELSEFGEEVLMVSRLKLGITQIEMAKRCGLSQSEISRMERGLVTPKDIPSFESICSGYNLNQKDCDQYRELVLGVKAKRGQYDLVPDLLKIETTNIINLHKRGNPTLAYEQAKSLREWYINHNAAVTEKTLENISELILLESSCLWDVFPPDKAKIMTDELLKLSYKLTKMTNSQIVKNNLLINLGFRAYLMKNFTEADLHFGNVDLEKLSNSKFDILRIQIVVSGKNQNIKRLADLENIATDLVSKNLGITATERAYLYEGLANAYGTIDPTKAYVFIKKSIDLLNTEANKPDFWKLRYIQSVRTLSLIVSIRKSLKDTAFDKNINNALRLCDEGGFARHKQQILQWLNV